jgi:hypothetical protein
MARLLAGLSLCPFLASFALTQNPPISDPQALPLPSTLALRLQRVHPWAMRL